MRFFLGSRPEEATYTIQQLLAVRPTRDAAPEDAAVLGGRVPLVLQDLPAEEATASSAARDRQARREATKARPKVIGPITECVPVDAEVLQAKRGELRQIEQITGVQIREKAGLRNFTIMITGTTSIVETALIMVENAIAEKSPDVQQRERPRPPAVMEPSVEPPPPRPAGHRASVDDADFAVPPPADDDPSSAYAAQAQSPNHTRQHPRPQQVVDSSAADEEWEILAHWQRPLARSDPAAEKAGCKGGKHNWSESNAGWTNSGWNEWQEGSNKWNKKEWWKDGGWSADAAGGAAAKSWLDGHAKGGKHNWSESNAGWTNSGWNEWQEGSNKWNEKEWWKDGGWSADAAGGAAAKSWLDGHADEGAPADSWFDDNANEGATAKSWPDGRADEDATAKPWHDGLADEGALHTPTGAVAKIPHVQEEASCGGAVAGLPRVQEEASCGGEGAHAEVDIEPFADESLATIPGRWRQNRLGAPEQPRPAAPTAPLENHVPAAGSQSSDANDEDYVDLGQDQVSDTLTNAGEVDGPTPKKGKTIVPVVKPPPAETVLPRTKSPPPEICKVAQAVSAWDVGGPPGKTCEDNIDAGKPVSKPAQAPSQLKEKDHAGTPKSNKKKNVATKSPPDAVVKPAPPVEAKPPPVAVSKPAPP
eukprot:CAMPEP_0172933744 /NCGR_PEP_ID=MMETSP1075-20121228/220659_1 /TAXON_ID=2916 /ORGANISM="Ceratium fusus, Strain PA161109" /LENGTH=648 /DNA_ID=CAMNT_0013795087 /DNA_START=128 /DNA_END=2070 /DNA_ORIENTATION=-